jgi:hypothetical protein
MRQVTRAPDRIVDSTVRFGVARLEDEDTRLQEAVGKRGVSTDPLSCVAWGRAR